MTDETRQSPTKSVSHGLGATRARQLVAAERRRQIEVEGWSAEHDDEHTDGEMLNAAVAYYLNGVGKPLAIRADGAPLGWLWDAKWWKPKNPHQDLVRAGALCLAEIDRLRRIKGSYRGHAQDKLCMILLALTQLSNSHRPEEP
jgi:hypothetical protein